MNFALVNGIKQVPEPKKSGRCPFCGAEVISKCGAKNIWHWSHKGKLECDPWWENETAWHRVWKNHFPIEWQEVRHKSETGEAHIADVKTYKGLVIEFQHSPLANEERLARNIFYKNLVWVVDGMRRKQDKEKFFEALKEVLFVKDRPVVQALLLVKPNKSALLREWGDCPGPVFFDFGEPSLLWCLLPKTSDGKQYVTNFSSSYFIAFHKDVESSRDYFAEVIFNLKKTVEEHSTQLKAREAYEQAQLRIYEQRRLALYRVSSRRNSRRFRL